MARAPEVKTVALVWTASNGDAITVHVAEDQAETLLGSGAYTKPATRKSNS